jgi:hypothetical protein
MTAAATISLFACLLLAGTAAAQEPQVIWLPAGQPKVVPPPAPPIQPVQYKFALPGAAAQTARLIEQVPPAQVLPPGQPGQPPKGGPVQPPDGTGQRKIGSKIKQSIEEYQSDISIQTEPPGLDRLTRRETEAEFIERLKMEARRAPGASRLIFPEEEPVSNEVYTGRHYPYSACLAEANYTCHGQLYFEQLNFERYGWDLGPITPAVNLGMFYYDIVMLPYHIGSQTCHCYDCSTGKCLPGDPTPLLLYRERFSLTGLVFEAGAVLGLNFAFP